MDEETVGRVVSPFETSRNHAQGWIGDTVFKMGAEECGGSFELSSKPGEGTYISASYAISNIGPTSPWRHGGNDACAGCLQRGG